MSTAKPKVCPIHGENCPGDSGHMFMDMNHPDDMFGVHIMSVEPIFEVRLFPKDPKASIQHIDVRIDDPRNLYDADTVITFLEQQFPMYNIAHILSGYRQVISNDQIGPTDS